MAGNDNCRTSPTPAAPSHARAEKGGLKKPGRKCSRGCRRGDPQRVGPRSGSPRPSAMCFWTWSLVAGGAGHRGFRSNFVRLLAENRRLVLLPDIVAMFEALKAEAVVEARGESRPSRSATNRRPALQPRSNKLAAVRIELEVTVDPNR